MILIAIMGVLLAATGEVASTVRKREKEQELLFVGNQFRRAIRQYYEQSPGLKRYPTSLEDLLKDPRYPNTRRYLRRLYPDPITGSEEWGLLKGPNGEVFGVYSRSDDEPMKKAQFSRDDATFEGKTKYSEWIFMRPPTKTDRPASLPVPAAAPKARR